MLNENTDGASKKKRKRKRKVDAEGQTGQAACIFLHRRHTVTHYFVPTFCKVFLLLGAQKKPNKGQEIKEKRTKNEAETEDGKKHC